MAERSKKLTAEGEEKAAAEEPTDEGTVTDAPVAVVEPVVSVPAEPEPAPAAPTRTYTAERLIAEAEDFLGVPSHVVAGAFHGQKDDNWTIDEAKARVDAWLKEEV